MTEPTATSLHIDAYRQAEDASGTAPLMPMLLDDTRSSYRLQLQLPEAATICPPAMLSNSSSVSSAALGFLGKVRLQTVSVFSITLTVIPVGTATPFSFSTAIGSAMS